MYYEARLQAFVDYNANVLRIGVKKAQVRQFILQRETDLTEQQYVQVLK